MDHYLKQKNGLAEYIFFNGDQLKTYFKWLLLYVLMKKSYGKKCALITCMYMKHNMIFKIIRTRKKIHYPYFC